MEDQNNLLKTIPNIEQLIQSLGPPIAPEDLDTHLKIKEFDLRSYHFRTYINTWKEQQDQDRGTRKYYAKWLLIVVCVQIFIINLLFTLIGLGFLNVQEWTANTFIMSVFVEISAMVLIVVNYLFPKAQKSLPAFWDILKRGGSR
jgi:hypothetical protein